MQKLYARINWENEPSIETPLNEQNLNRMDAALGSLDDRVISQDAIKADKTELNNLLADWYLDEETGVITATKKSGEKILFDLNIEKIPVSFSLSEDGILTMVTEDGTAFTANIGAMIPVLTFADSDDIIVSASGSGVNKTYSFSIKAGSVTQEKLNPDLLSDMQVAAAHAESYAQSSKLSAKEAESYARGGTDTREGEDADNALYYKEQAKAEADRAKSEADRASDTVGIGIATTEKAGIVKPDGDTIEVDEDGTIHASKVGNLSALTLPYNGADDTETTKEVVDALKNDVENIVVPTKTSELLNDSDYQTSEDVKTAIDNIEIPKGNIESISVNGENISPDSNKNVNISVSTKTSQLENDSEFITKDDLGELDTSAKANAYESDGTYYADMAKFAKAIGTVGSDGTVGGANVGAFYGNPIYFENGIPKKIYTADSYSAVVSMGACLVTSTGLRSYLQYGNYTYMEVGGWTPTFISSGSNDNSNTQWVLEGKYVKVGNIVFIMAYGYDPSGHNTVYYYGLNGLPYPPKTISFAFQPTHGTFTFIGNNIPQYVCTHAVSNGSSLQLKGNVPFGLNAGGTLEVAGAYITGN